jgi:hypothetical protein
MRRFHSVLLLVMCSFSLLSYGEQSCLWLNVATAGGILGGPVTLSVSHPNPGPGAMQPANATSAYGPTSANPSGASYASNTVDDSDCAFARQPPKAGGMHISVRTVTDPQKAFAAYSAQCGARGLPLQAIGNEAMVCDVQGKNSRLSEQVVGRIRDRVFLMNLTSGDPSVTPGDLREKARAAAEIVAGNLF